MMVDKQIHFVVQLNTWHQKFSLEVAMAKLLIGIYLILKKRKTLCK